MISNPFIIGDVSASDIQPVGWIQSDGTSYIDLGANVARDGGVNHYPRVIMTCPSATTSRTFGRSIIKSTSGSLSLDFGLASASKVFVQGGNGETRHNGVEIGNVADDTRHVVDFTGISAVAFGLFWNLYLDRVDKGTDDESYGGEQFSHPDGNVFVFGMAADSSRTDVRVHGIEFYTNVEASFPNLSLNVLKRSFIPALLNGEAGLWDNVRGTWHGNAASSGEILYGD